MQCCRFICCTVGCRSDLHMYAQWAALGFGMTNSWKKTSMNIVFVALLHLTGIPSCTLGLIPWSRLSLFHLSPPLPPRSSFGVVLWELLTGKRPYDTLNLFVVAYGVGHGTLSLPIPDGCPQPLATLLNGELTPLHEVLSLIV